MPQVPWKTKAFLCGMRLLSLLALFVSVQRSPSSVHSREQRAVSSVICGTVRRRQGTVLETRVARSCPHWNDAAKETVSHHLTAEIEKRANFKVETLPSYPLNSMISDKKALNFVFEPTLRLAGAPTRASKQCGKVSMTLASFSVASSSDSHRPARGDFPNLYQEQISEVPFLTVNLSIVQY